VSCGVCFSPTTNRTGYRIWGHKTRDKNEVKPREEVPVGLPGRRQGLTKFYLLLVSIAFSTAVFLTLDWFRTSTIVQSSMSAKENNCRISDRARHHSYKPNCSFNDHWGKDWFDFSTNSLGFRDERIRQVPLTDSRLRLLLLGDSFTEGQVAWRDTYVGMIAARLPQYDFLNGGVGSYSPSNYLNVARMVLASGVQFDEVIVFIDTGDAADEAAFYRDIGPGGAVAGPVQQRWSKSWYATVRHFIAKHLLLSNYIVEFFERKLVEHGYYHVTMPLLAANVFDVEGAAWPYRKINETDPYPSGYAPLGLEGGIAKEKVKMDLLWQDLQQRNIPIGVVVYPYPGQILHDTANSRQVRIWQDWCEGKCKRFISLFPEFLAAKDQCPRSQPGCWYPNNFIFGDFHYNVGGNALVADAVVKSLDRDPPVKRQPLSSGSAPKP
jgi:hypothetical protein